MDFKAMGLTQAKINQFNKAGIENAYDLLRIFPKKYYDFTHPVTDFTECIPGCMQAVVGKVLNIVEKSNKLTYVKIKSDHNQYAYAYFFGASAYMAKQLEINRKAIFCGRLDIKHDFNDQIQIFPLICSHDISACSVIYPVYKKVPGMSDTYYKETLRKCMKLLDNTADFLEPEVISLFDVVGEQEAFRLTHFPQTAEDYKNAQRRFIFDDLFLFNFKLKNESLSINSDSEFVIKDTSIWNKLYPLLPYKFTQDQADCLKSMLYNYFAKGKRLNALVQGDVGSGKTIVALFAMSLFLSNNIQSCLIAPTEILAKQHYEEFLKIFPQEYHSSIRLLTGSLTAKQKKKINEEIENGSALIVIGTHAVIQDSVHYNNLGLVIVDEQHRFGVKQRNALSGKISTPHMINLSATPIPSTLAQTIYGDSLEVYTIKTKPDGRLPVITRQAESDEEVNQEIANQVFDGKQCYVICPLIEESESDRMADVEAVETVYFKLKKRFENTPDIKIGLINGKMKQSEIDNIINSFYNKEINVLVSTTIVEVGVNVPDATLIVIKNSERFGLAQLHQLRGRVGRNSYQSFCLLQPIRLPDEKADIMCSTTDGFKIAQEDMRLRGPGDIIGEKQSGMNKYIMLQMAFPDIVCLVRETIDEIYNSPDRYQKYSFINEENSVLV